MTDQYTPKPGDLVQLKSGSDLMTAGETSTLDGRAIAKTECWFDSPDGPRKYHIPTACLEPAEVEDESDGDVMQARVNALREALREIIGCTDENYNANTVALEALRADNLLNDEETEP